MPCVAHGQQPALASRGAGSRTRKGPGTAWQRAQTSATPPSYTHTHTHTHTPIWVVSRDSYLATPPLTRTRSLPYVWVYPHPAPQGEGKLRWVERSYGGFRRAFALPDAADADGIRASVKDGVVTVAVPKRPVPAPKMREVPVVAEGAGGGGGEGGGAAGEGAAGGTPAAA